TLPDGVKRITAPTNHGMLMTRIRVIDANDFPNAVAIEGKLSLTPLSKYPSVEAPARFVKDALTTYYPVVRPATLGASFYDELSAALAEIGVAPGLKPTATTDPVLLKLLEAAVPATDAFIRAQPINAKNSVTVN